MISEGGGTARRMSKEWPVLEEKAIRAYERGTASRWADLTVLFELECALMPMQRVPIIDNAYYAYGQAIDGFVGHLSHETARQQAINKGASLLIEASAEQGGNLRALNTKGCNIARAFLPAIHAGYTAAPGPIQLLGNYLVTENNLRPQKAIPTTAFTRRRLVLAQMAGGVVPMLAAGMHDAVAKSPQYIIDTILSKRGIQLSNGDMPTAEDLAKLKVPEVEQLATHLCTVSSANSFGAAGPVMNVDDESAEFCPPPNGRPTFYSHRTHITEADNDHEAGDGTLPMICPALHIKGAVILGLNMTVDMVDLARQKLEA